MIAAIPPSPFMDFSDKALEHHRKVRGKITITLTAPLRTHEELSLSYTPGVAEPCKVIAKDTAKVWELTGRRNRVAVITDGSAVLGLGNIGPEAAMPVMEGKAALFKEFGNVDAFPICLGTQDTQAIIDIVKALAPSFGGINLEDISAPRCFEIEEALKAELTIPVFHDDQHGTAIVTLGGLTNALNLTGRTFKDARFVISGAGAAGTAIARILLSQGVRYLLMVDRDGIINRNQNNLDSAAKTFLASATNTDSKEGSLSDALVGADIFIGVSAPNIVTEEMIKSMNNDPIVFAMANPDPEIMPERAKRAGAAIVATGRSDFPNQVNNVLAFPGVFRGALDAEAEDITEKMKLAAAQALAEYVQKPTTEMILPDPLDKGVGNAVAKAVAKVV